MRFAGKFIWRLASLKLTVVLLLLLCLLVIAGTVYQAENGMYAAQRNVFGAWIIWLFGTVTPAGPAARRHASCSSTCWRRVMFRLKYRWRQAGLILVHYGLLLFISGGFFISLTAREYFLTLREGESSRVAGSGSEEETRTNAVRQEVCPAGRDQAARFRKRPCTRAAASPGAFPAGSRSVPGRTRRVAVISMNRPLRVREYTFYQSSYVEDGMGRESSTFSVVRNAGRWLPYIASALIFLGLAGHFLAMLGAALKKNASRQGAAMKKIIVLAVLACWLAES